MPIPLFKHHFCRRNGTGPKAHAHAAYLSGTKLDNGEGQTADFTPKGGILHADVWVPEGAPEWAKDRGELWRRLEAREDRSTRRADAILAHKFIGALPCELSLEDNIRYVKDFIREEFTRKGYAADWAIHAPDQASDRRNYHVHIMVPLRKFENGDWAKTKDRFPKNSPALSQYIKAKQEAFFELQNRYLAKNGIKAEIMRKNGKWTVVQEFSLIPTTTHRHRTSQPAPSTTSAPKTPSLGVGRNGLTLREILSRSMEAASQKASNSGDTAKVNPSTKEWPAEAIKDWELWGEKSPTRFFLKWPELSTGNPSLGGRL